MNKLDKMFERNASFMIVKPTCPYCVKALKLRPDLVTLNYDEYAELVEEIKTYFNHKTYPMIFIDKKFIGGYSDLSKLYEV